MSEKRAKALVQEMIDSMDFEKTFVEWATEFVENKYPPFIEVYPPRDHHRGTAMSIKPEDLGFLKDTMRELLDQPKLPRRREVELIVQLIRGFEERGEILRKIAEDYMSPNELRNTDEAQVLKYEEVLEMAYENMQAEAAAAMKKTRGPTVKK